MDTAPGFTAFGVDFRVHVIDKGFEPHRPSCQPCSESTCCPSPCGGKDIHRCNDRDSCSDHRNCHPAHAGKLIACEANETVEKFNPAQPHHDLGSVRSLGPAQSRRPGCRRDQAIIRGGRIEVAWVARIPQGLSNESASPGNARQNDSGCASPCECLSHPAVLHKIRRC